MFNLLTSLIGFFDKRFVLAYWSPVAVALSGLAGVVALDQGLAGTLKGVNDLPPMSKIVLAVTVVVAITVLAYALQALTAPIVQLFEGYGLPGWLTRPMTRDQLRIRETLEQGGETELATALQQTARYWYYPVDDTSVAPTRLGNALAAAEEYPRKVYSPDTALWWPRLAVVLPDSFAAQVDASLIPMIALLNLTLGFTVFALAGGTYLYVANRGYGYVAPLLGGFLLAWMCYRAAVSQAVGYGNVIRVAFDYYRHDVIKQLGFPIPASVKEEHGFWEKMNQLAFNYVGPWTAPGGTDPLAYVKADAGDDEPDKAAPAGQPQPTAQAQLPPPAPVQDPHLHKGTRKEPHLHSRKKKNDG